MAESCEHTVSPISPVLTFSALVEILHVRGLSGKFEDTVNTEAKTSNNMELFLFVWLRTI